MRAHETEPRNDTWDAVWREKGVSQPSGMGRRIFDEIITGINVQGQEILELGCGSGELLRLAADHGARRVIGVDISSQALNVAQTMLSRVDHHLIYGDMFKLDRTPQADIVWSSGVLEHFSCSRLLEVMRLHCALARKHVVVVVPASLHWNDIRMRSSKIKTAYGWQLPLSCRRLIDLGRSAGLHVRNVRRFMIEYSWELGSSRYLLYALRARWPRLDNWFGGLAIAWYDVV